MKPTFLIALIVLIGCSQDAVEPIFDGSNAGISLTNLAQSRISYYLKYEASCGGSFKYTGDTLIVRTFIENDTVYIEEMSIEPSSNELYTSKYRVVQHNDYILIPERFQSKLFNFYGNDTLFLSKQPSLVLKQKGCRLFLNGEAFIGEQIATIDKFQFGSFLISNKKGVSCVPTLLRMDGYLIYDDQLSLSHAVWEDGNVRGYLAISK